MMKNFSLKYGKSEVSFVLDGARSIQTLTENPMNTIEDIHAAFLKAISTDVIESPALDQLVSPEDQITIVISDMTRFWMRQDIICEELVRYLNEVIGIPFEHIVVLIGLGTHHKNTPADQKVLTGAYVYGTVHHLMAGYGGGRKSIVPGIAGRETIRHNHAMALDPHCEQSDPRVGPGKFNNNPINEDMREAGALLHPVFGINIVVNSASRHSGLFCGDFDAAWRESCKYVQQCYGLPIKDQADVVFVSCGGFLIRVFVKPLRSPAIFSMLPVKISARPIFFCWPVLSWMPGSSTIWASENMTAWKISWLMLISKAKMFTSSLTVAASCLRRKLIIPVSAQKSK